MNWVLDEWIMEMNPELVMSAEDAYEFWLSNGGELPYGYYYPEYDFDDYLAEGDHEWDADDYASGHSTPTR
jgi:hypothetical protein